MEGKKKISLPIKVVIIGLVMGLIVAGIGGVKQINAKKTNEERRQASLKAAKEDVAKANARLLEIEKEYNELKAQYDAKADECSSIVTGSDGWLQRSSKCNREEQELQTRMWNLETENTSIKSNDYTAYYKVVNPMSYQIFYIIGASIAGLALLGAFIIYLVKGKKPY